MNSPHKTASIKSLIPVLLRLTFLSDISSHEAWVAEQAWTFDMHISSPIDCNPSMIDTRRVKGQTFIGLRISTWQQTDACFSFQSSDSAFMKAISQPAILSIYTNIITYGCYIWLHNGLIYSSMSAFAFCFQFLKRGWMQTYKWTSKLQLHIQPPRCANIQPLHHHIEEVTCPFNTTSLLHTG